MADCVLETGELKASSLASMQIELDKIHRKSAYNQALLLCPEFVTKRRFRLMFLRAKKFDATKAASALVEYLEAKLELWGPAKLVKVISLDDFSQIESKTLKAGLTQVLPSRDRAGRAIVVDFTRLHEGVYDNQDSQVR